LGRESNSARGYVFAEKKSFPVTDGLARAWLEKERKFEALVAEGCMCKSWRSSNGGGITRERHVLPAKKSLHARGRIGEKVAPRTVSLKEREE